MIANYHTHTKRCKHAVGEDEAYVRAAVERGLSILGFSDHAPYIYPDGYVSYYKMEPYELSEYFESVSALREKYKSKIEIVKNVGGDVNALKKAEKTVADIANNLTEVFSEGLDYLNKEL